MAPRCQNKKNYKGLQNGNGKSKNRIEVERKFQEWKDLKELKDDHINKDYKIPVKYWLRLGYFMVIFMLLYSTYCIYYNLSRERVEGSARSCARSCGKFVNFDLDDVFKASYPNFILPNPWSLPNPDRDSQLRKKACRSSLEWARDRRARRIGT